MISININEVKIRPHTGFEFELADRVDVEAYGYSEYSLPGETRVTGRLSDTGDGVFTADFRFNAEAHLICGRCGRPFSLPLSGEVSAVFAEDAWDDVDGEQDIYPLKDGAADLGLVLANEIGLLLPMRPLCSEDCPGLCPHCGADLASGPCACMDTQIDPRWEKLRGLLKD